MRALFGGTYDGRKVLVTGHTGFKGAWLTAWLRELGADVVGLSLPEPPSDPSLFDLLGLGGEVADERGDVTDRGVVADVLGRHTPDVVLHLAAQPIVLEGYADPVGTFATNAMGTVHVLEAVRTTPSVRAVACITTDKVYRNEEWVWGYRESDALGGKDPYSASKAMAELAIDAYTASFFAAERYHEHGVAVASARAGNVIGGGDFAPHRLVPDCVRALLDGQRVGLRNSASIRPWQHVLEPLSGYLQLVRWMLEEGPDYGGAWNFGPLETDGVTTAQLADRLIAGWGEGSWEDTHPFVDPPKETSRLRLAWDQAAARLGWRPVWTWEDAIDEIVAWTRAYQRGDDLRGVVRGHLDQYVGRARAHGLAWVTG